MKTFASSITIHAAPETIWAILTDAPAYPEWNPTVDKVEGTIERGQKIKVFAKISPDRAFPVKVSEFKPSEKMVWSGGMPLGLFKGERTFTLTPGADGSVEFAMREVFSGLMSPLIERSIPDLQPEFDRFADALKRKAEAS
jgi:hypothetical protein